MYKSSYSDVVSVQVTVEVTPTIKSGPRSVTFVPSGPLRMELGVEDASDALEFNYGWERFVAELTKQVVADIARQIRVKVVRIESAETSQAQLEEDDLLEFLEEEFPGEFGE